MDRKKDNISRAVIKRLPKYHRYLQELLENKVDRISSKELSEKIGFTASQIRQDLNCFGDFGQQGYGYNVEALYNEIKNILGLHKKYSMTLIGCGNIGQAVANYDNFRKIGFEVETIFDKNPRLIGLKIRGIEVRDVEELEEFLKNSYTDIGVICVNKENAQGVCDILVNGGVKGIWNFAPVDLVVPSDVKVEDVYLSESLLTLSCLLNGDM